MNNPEKRSSPLRYSTEARVYDEMRDASGSIRPHWEEMAGVIEELSVDELVRRNLQGSRILREIGVTYNVHSDTRDMNRPWRLDPIPLIVSAQDWATIETGLIERAILLDMILRDLYGPRKLLEQGIVPPELIYSHSGFLLPCDGTMPTDRRALVFYAADIVRDAQGKFWILGERAQSPSGAGYALENRITMTRVMSDALRSMPVRRLEPYFNALRSGLADIAPSRREPPRTVVLTSGPGDPSYFEHAYLAAYLGYPLVQGYDLTVRDGSVWLKSIDGLQPVEVILRRVNDFDCDPLELRPDSPWGVPGLLEAVRRGQVAIANPPGSGVLENPGLTAFMPAIARFFLGGDLSLHAPPTWWCGHTEAGKRIESDLKNLVIKSIDRFFDPVTLIGEQRSDEELEAWKIRIKTHPYGYALQEPIRFSTVPTLINSHLEPRPTIVRCFLVAGGDSYTVLAGGLARSAFNAEDRFITAENGAISKDVWALSSGPEPQISVWQYSKPSETSGSFRSLLPSHTAENLYWVGRYAERAEVTTRLFRTVLRKLTEQDEFDDPGEKELRHILLRTLTRVTGAYPGFIGEGGGRRRRHPEPELIDILLNPDRAGSLSSTLQAMMKAAYAIRERWSVDIWRVFDDTEEHWNTLRSASVFTLSGIRDNLDQLITDLMALTGLSMESMTRELGWVMLDSGRRIERGLLLIAQLRATLTLHVDPAVESLLLESLLLTNENLITYRRRYRSYLHLQTVLDLLLLDESNPRALIYQLDRLCKYLPELPYDRTLSRMSEEERLMLEASSALKLSDMNRLTAESGKEPLYKELDDLLERIEKLLERASEILIERFFSHTHVPQQMIPASRES